MDTILDDIVTAKEYQLQSFYNDLLTMKKNCNNNVTESVARTLIQLVAEEAIKREIKLIEY